MTSARCTQVGEQPIQAPALSQDNTDTRADGGSSLPLVSVIIPAYNAARFIARTLDSVLSQSYRNIEVLVVNDGSTDETVQIIKRFCLRDPRIILLEQPHSGVAAARNHAIEAARGEFVAPIDADDIWYRDKLKEQVDCILRSGLSVGLVYTWSMMIEENEAPIAGIAHDLQGDVLADLIYANFVGNGSSPLIRRSCLDQVGRYDLQLKDRCEDWDIYLRIAEKYEFRVVPKFYAAYRQLPNGLSSDYSKMEESFSLLMRNLQLRHPEIPGPLRRLSKSCFYFYLFGKTSSKGHHWKGLVFLLRCLRLDPMRFFSSEFYLAFLRWLLRLAANLFTPLVWRDLRAWHQTKRHLRNTLIGDPVILEDGKGLPAKRSPTRVYDRIHNRRMNRLRKKIAAFEHIRHSEAPKDEKDSWDIYGGQSEVS